MRQLGTVSSKGLGSKISVKGNLDPVSRIDHYKDVLDHQSLITKMHLVMGGDRDKISRAMFHLSRFLNARPDITTVKQLMPLLSKVMASYGHPTRRKGKWALGAEMEKK